MLSDDERDPGRAGPGGAPTPGEDPQRELDGVVRTIGRRAQRTNLSRAAQLSTALDEAAGGELDPVGRERAVELAHQLVGSAGTFGFAVASELAGQLEEFFTGGVFDEPGIRAARLQLQALDHDLQGDPPG